MYTEGSLAKRSEVRLVANSDREWEALLGPIGVTPSREFWLLPQRQRVFWTSSWSFIQWVMKLPPHWGFEQEKGELSELQPLQCFRKLEERVASLALVYHYQVYCEIFPISDIVTDIFSWWKHLFSVIFTFTTLYACKKNFGGIFCSSYNTDESSLPLWPSEIWVPTLSSDSYLVFSFNTPGVTQNGAVFTIMCWSFLSPSDEILLIIHTNIINHLCFCRRIYHTVLPETVLFQGPICHTWIPLAELNQKVCFCQSDLRR